MVNIIQLQIFEIYTNNLLCRYQGYISYRSEYIEKITFQVLKRPTLQYALGLEWDKNTKLKHFFKPKSLPRNPYYALQVYKAFRQGEALWPNPSSDPIYWLSEK